MMETQEEVINSFSQIFSLPLSELLFRIVVAIAIVFVGRLISKWLTRAAKRAMDRAKTDQMLISFLGNITYYALLLIVTVIALGVLGFPTTSIIAVLGAATLAIGLALQDSIANLASGVLIIFLRPFRIGDYVETSDEEGFVTDIRLFHTLLTTRDNKAIYLPNKDVMGNNITNYSDTPLIRIDLVYGIGYSDDVLQAKRILEEIVVANDLVAKDPAPVIAVKELGDSSVNLIAWAYVEVKNEMIVTYNITEQVKVRFDQEGISIPFPQRDIHLFQPN
ncbi:MAG TPA: mechanosensitive ion channel protein [Chloroflexi bacterium]|nr:mechanosensitive ion channel protein [Chloroflexota bacterium]